MIFKWHCEITRREICHTSVFNFSLKNCLLYTLFRFQHGERLPVLPPITFTSVWHKRCHQPPSSLIPFIYETDGLEKHIDLSLTQFGPFIPFGTFLSTTLYHPSPFSPHFTRTLPSTCPIPLPTALLNEARLHGDVEA